MAWKLSFGNFSSIPLYVKELSYEHYGLSVDHLMVLLQGHVDWFVGNLQPVLMQSKALTEPDPWINWLIPQVCVRYTFVQCTFIVYYNNVI